MRQLLTSNVDFVRSNSRWLASGFLLTLFSTFGQTYFIGLSGNDLRERFSLSGGEFGGLYMLATLASALALPWLGRSLDVMPGWKVVSFTIPALAFACVLTALAPNVAILGVAIFLLRLFGQGMMTETAFTEVGRWFAANRGRAMAIIVQGHQLGVAVIPALMVVVHRASGDWRTGWFAAAALLLAAFPAFIALMRVERIAGTEEEASASGRTARDWTRAEVLRDPILYLLLAGTLAPPFIGTVIFFHQGYLIELRDYDPLGFAAAFPVMAVSTVVFSLSCGHLIDRHGALRLLPYFLIPLAVASAAVGLVTPVWGIYLFMALLGVSNGFTSTLFGALWPEVYGVANLGGIRAITVSAMVFATAAGPGITGWLIDRGVALPTQMLWMAGWSVAACFLLAAASVRIRRRES